MIEIIPRPIKQVVRWQRILLYVLVFLAILLIIVYFILSSLQQRAEVSIQELEKKLIQGTTPQMLSLEEEALYYKSKINEFSPFLKDHILSTKFFAFIEEKVHPRVFFSQLNLDSENSKVILSGSSDSFLSLGQQLLIFNEDPMVENIELSDVSISSLGGINFITDITLAKEFFRY